MLLLIFYWFIIVLVEKQGHVRQVEKLFEEAAELVSYN